jgi:hypothetical protein
MCAGSAGISRFLILAGFIFHSGVPLPHNFFITSDNIGQKDIILGQPWLFSYSVRIDYAHSKGMNLQVWKDGDHEGQSVHVTLRIMSAPCNVFPIQLIKH